MLKQKEKLYKKKDVNAWGTNAEDISEAQKNMDDPQKSLKYILPNSTKEVDLLKQEYEYFTNQMFKEIKRVNMIQYDQARELFVDAAEISTRFLYEQSLKWQEFLQFYTGLNIERKQYDQKYQQDHKIGEEIDQDEDEDMAS